MSTLTNIKAEAESVKRSHEAGNAWDYTLWEARKIRNQLEKAINEATSRELKIDEAIEVEEALDILAWLDEVIEATEAAIEDENIPLI
jgi:hypothetical protein